MNALGRRQDSRLGRLIRGASLLGVTRLEWIERPRGWECRGMRGGLLCWGYARTGYEALLDLLRGL